MPVVKLSISDTWDQAWEKARDPRMTLDNNPLRKDIDPMRHIQEKNMDRLHADARAWNDPKSGAIYRAIRGMTYNKGE